MSRTRSLLMCGTAALTLALAPAEMQAATQQVVSLSGPRVSVVDASRIVVTFETRGDVRGLLTLIIDRDPAGDPSAMKGQWALVSRYLRDLVSGSEDLGVPTVEHDALVHEEKIAIMDRGTIHGAIAEGTLVFDANGALTGIEGLRLEIAGGYIEFKGAAGAASVSASDLQDVYAGSGTLVLAQEVK